MLLFKVKNFFIKSRFPLPPAISSDPHLVCLEDYPIHTVTGLVKQWLRELPDPLMTFMHYNDFLHAIGEKGFSHKGAAFFSVSHVWVYAFSFN